MASTQVLPNVAASTVNKKQELLAAGKRRLEEFRRKKALEKGKNSTEARKTRESDDHISSQALKVQTAGLDDVGPSSRGDGNETTDETRVITSGSEMGEIVNNNNVQVSNSQIESVEPVPSNNDALNSCDIQLNSVDQESKPGMVWSNNTKENYKVSTDVQESNEELGICNGQLSQHTIYEPNYYSESASDEKDKVSSESDINSSFSFSRPDSNHSQSVAGFGTSFENKKVGSSFSFLPSLFSAPSAVSETLPSSYKSDSSLSDYDSTKINTTSRRSRPSFLDTIKVPPPTPFPSPAQSTQINKNTSNIASLSELSEALNGVEAPKSYGSSSTDNTFDKSPHFPVSGNNGSYQFSSLSNGNLSEHENTFHSVKQNEDFSALEQHIEDLTREKFSLQRSVEASRALAESLASENSALTDSYNQQGSVVNQLRLEMENLQNEIRGKSTELEAVKGEYGNVLLECNAADERAKLLASEVIYLEEKALRLRSNELKLERLLEDAVSESSLLKKRISSLERERQGLQASISAIQEEKKMLQNKLRKLSSNKSDQGNYTSSNKKNASTSTNNLDYSGQTGASENLNTSMYGIESSSEIIDLNSTRSPENIDLNLHIGSVSIPSDQMGVIQNINALLSELALEKEELIGIIKTESSECSKFKELNKELSKKLELQTQRLELLTAQSMAGDNVVTRQTEFLSTSNPIVYADEGDEVVERVLGWIMKLFPRGPSKRRTSKLI